MSVIQSAMMQDEGTQGKADQELMEFGPATSWNAMAHQAACPYQPQYLGEISAWAASAGENPERVWEALHINQMQKDRAPEQTESAKS